MPATKLDNLSRSGFALVLGVFTLFWCSAETPVLAQRAPIVRDLPDLPDLPDRDPADGDSGTRLVQTYTRGDINDDGGTDVSDAIRLLGFLFGSSGDLSCLAAADVNTDRAVDISDAASLLGYLFSEEAVYAEGFPTCGSVPTVDSLDCASSSACPTETVYDIFFETGEETQDHLELVRERVVAAGYQPGRLSETGLREVRGRLRLPAHFNRGGPGLTVNEAIIVADELQLHADVQLELAPEVRHLTILVNRLSAEPGAVITWSPKALGTPAPWGENNEPVVSYNPDAEDHGTVGPKSANGGNGPSGRPGRPGHEGQSGPTVEIWALEVDGLPDFRLAGQQGSEGGRGQNGRDGGHGSRGLHSVSRLTHCERGPGRGGDGGKGGDGGAGGRGGRGGDGGQVVISTLEANFLDILTNGIRYDLSAGAGGRGGLPGIGGLGGRGGRQGRTEGWCREVDGRDGRPGSNGSPSRGIPVWLLEQMGLRGPSGSSGDRAEKPISAVVITRADWEEMFDKPQIETIDPTEVELGAEVEIRGANFDPTHVVLFGDANASTTFISSGLLLATVPFGASVGEVEVRVRTAAGTFSNPFFVVVRPSARSVEVKGSPGQTPRLGDVLVIRGSGFGAGSFVIFRDVTIEPRILSSSTLEVRLPRPGGAYEEMGGPESLVVVSSSGVESAEATFQLAHVLDTGFDPTRDAFGFKNAYDPFFQPHLVGRASRAVFEETYGEAEVLASYAVSPVLTEAYYQFFKWFFNERKPGLSSAFAMLAVDEYWSGQDLGANTTHECSPSEDCVVDANWERQLTIASGHVLSGQNLHAIGQQALVGIDQGEIALARIESMIRSQIGRSPAVARRLAPVAMTVPTGPIGTNLTEKLADAHGLLPIAVEFPSQPGDHFEAKIYFYNNWYDIRDHGDYSQYMVFHRNGQVLDYEFVDTNDSAWHDPTDDSEIHWSSRDDWTLAVLSLEDALLTDVDLPLTYVASLTKS